MKIPNGDIYETCRNIAWSVDKRNVSSYPSQRDSKGPSLILTKELVDYLINNNMINLQKNKFFGDKNDNLILEIPKGTYMEKIDNDIEDTINWRNRFVIYGTNLELVFDSDDINSKPQFPWERSFKPNLMKMDPLKEMILKSCTKSKEKTL